MSQLEVHDVYGLTPLQQGILFHAVLEREAGLYFEQITVPYAGDINWPVFQASWQDVANRHDALRTSFHWEDVSSPIQVVHAEARMDIDAVDLLTSSGGPTRSLQDFLHADRARGFDLERPPLFRVSLVRSRPEGISLVLSFHHLILDGWSLQVVLRDFAAAYRDRVSGRDPELIRIDGYQGYLAWLQEQDLDAAEKYWREELRGVEPPARRRRRNTARDFGELQFVLSAATNSAAERAASASRVTVNTVAQAAWALSMALSDGSNDQTFGIVVSGRPAELPGVEDIVGLFINTIPLRVRIDEKSTVGAWMRRVQGDALEARRFEYSPLAEVQQWSGVPAGTALFESILAFENYPISAGEAGEAEEGQPSAMFAERTNYPLNAIIVPGTRLTLRLLYDRRFFDGIEVRRIAERFELLLLSLAEDPDALVGTLPTVTTADQTLLAGLHGPDAGPAEGTVHGRFASLAAEHPNAPALQFGERIWTYRDVDACSDAIAMRLTTAGVTPGDRVAVLIERCATLPVALLGVLKAGAAYVPLDPENASSRIDATLDDTSAKMVLTSAGLSESHSFGTPTMIVDAELPAAPVASRHDALVRESPAYVMYTSGSTGEPKGIIIGHDAVIDLVCATDYVQVQPGDRVGQLSNCSFDATTFEIWAPLLNGGCVVGIDRDTVLTPHRFSEFVEHCELDILFVTTALFNRVATEAPATFAPLRVLLFGGEAVDPASVRAVLAAGAPGRIVHVYGPTECTTFATWYEVEHVAENATTVSIGSGTSGTSVHVLDQYLRPVAVGAVGELCLGGRGLAYGYLGRAAATAEQFVPAENGRRWYRTGDLVRVAASGIEYVGRRDQQVKIRGFRVELGEVEQIVLEHELVEACIVVAPMAHDGGRELVVYAASACANAERLVDDLAKLLRDRLPRYLQPSAVVVVPKLPINRNGKIDREALPAPSIKRRPVPLSDVSRPRTPTEHAVAAIWCEVLNYESVGLDDDFFELGGHSLRATQLLSRIRRDLSAELELREIFDSPTVAEIAELVDANDHEQTDDHRIVPISRESRRLGSATGTTDPGQEA